MSVDLMSNGGTVIILEGSLNAAAAASFRESVNGNVRGEEHFDL